MSTLNRNDLAFWFPRIAAAGLPVPRTEIVTTDVPLMDLLDGEVPDGWDNFVDRLHAAVQLVDRGEPVFLRTGHGSGKHQWSRCCFVDDPLRLEYHISALVEWSASAGFFGLPTTTWAARKLISTAPICRCEGYGGMPVVREFRFFADERGVTHLQPYWPPDAVEQGRPDAPDWRERLADLADLNRIQERQLGSMAIAAAAACGGDEWSVDFLQDRMGCWWLTDMALGADSFRWMTEAAT